MARLPVPEFRRNQDQFLQYLYDDGAISVMHEIDPSTIADVLGLDDGMKDRVVDALLQDNYVAQAGYTGSLHLTPAGRRHVEQPTQGAPGGSTVVNFNGPNTGQISTGPNATMRQTNNTSNADIELLRQLIDEARQLNVTSLSADDRDVFIADIEILERQVDSSAPVSGFRRALRTMRDTAVAATGSAGGQGIVAIVQQLI